MDYKEIYQQVYEYLEEELGREPTWQETEEAFRDRLSEMVSTYDSYEAGDV